MMSSRAVSADPSRLIYAREFLAGLSRRMSIGAANIFRGWAKPTWIRTMNCPS